MYSSIVRIQNTFGFFTTVAFAIAALIAASDFLSPRTPTVGSLKTTNVQVVRGRPHYYSTKKEEYAIIKFSLDADLSDLFTWNTKQVFVYVTAEWPEGGSPNATNKAVIWDSIITSPSADHLTNLGPASKKKLIKSAKGKSIDPSRFVPFYPTI
jgi:signal peptidase complex subunit 3